MKKISEKIKNSAAVEVMKNIGIGAGIIYGFIVGMTAVVGAAGSNVADEPKTDDIERTVDRHLKQNINMNDASRCYYIAPGIGEKLEFEEARHGTFLSAIFEGVTLFNYDGSKTHDLGTMPVIESSRCGVIDPKQEITRNDIYDAVDSLRDIFMQSDHMKKALDGIEHNGTINTRAVNATPTVGGPK